VYWSIISFEFEIFYQKKNDGGQAAGKREN
jgi:hypothetical protein